MLRPVPEEKIWVPLGDEAHGLVIDERIVAIAYAENVGPVYSERRPDGQSAYELWWVPVDAPDAREVLFGVGEGAADAWSTRWDRAKSTTEWLYRERLESR